MCVVRERGATVALVAQPHVTGFHGLDYQQKLYCDIHIGNPIRPKSVSPHQYTHHTQASNLSCKYYASYLRL